MPLAQSDAVRQSLLTRHGGQLPPQSALVSFPFRVRSKQVGTLQSPKAQLFEMQFESLMHRLPSAHFVHPPPQSTSDSLPFFMWSRQLPA
jgi:hypothetical protein